uniref:Izumo sperm-egg fusion protein 3 n=1 Tax=Varanus komodoensis TaxID=61221 RepID=A0A8D2KUR7_VARKO
MVPQSLLVFPLWLLSCQAVAGCLQCDRRFLDSVATVLKETLPEDLPDRDSFIERHIQALAALHGTFLQKKYERILGALRAMKKNGTWKGEEQSTQKSVSQSVSCGFFPLAVTEGPILDCWTCLRIATQCFDGELCGEDTERLQERAPCPTLAMEVRVQGAAVPTGQRGGNSVDKRHVEIRQKKLKRRKNEVIVEDEEKSHSSWSWGRKTGQVGKLPADNFTHTHTHTCSLKASA